MSKERLSIREKTIFDGFIVKGILKLLYTTWFKLSGWNAIEKPPEGAGITIAAPHTSNWDIVFALGAAIIFDIKIYFSIKESWCQMPLVGSVMLWLGGIPINRSSGAQGQVGLIKEFVEKHRNQRIFFLFTPEGTRGGVKQWKTGFYHVAKDCNLPIFLAKVDYRTKETGVFHSFDLCDDKDRDIANLQESYKSVCGRYPDTQFPAYLGPLPQISPLEKRIMKAMYSLKGMATKTEISTRAKLEELSVEMLDYLVAKGILEKGDYDDHGLLTSRYKLTVAGNGCLFHLAPSL